MSRSEIMASISRDLGIKKYSGESDAEFVSRLTYSSLGVWARFLAAFPDGSGKQVGNIHKSAHHRKLAEILNRYLLIDEDIEEYYTDDDAIARIRLPLLVAKDINEVGFESRISIGEPCCMAIDQDYALEIANSQVPARCVSSGLAFVTANKMHAENDQILSAWGIPEESAIHHLEVATANACWEPLTLTESFELFDAGKKGTLSACWVPLKVVNRIPCIIRRKLSFGQYEYYLAKDDAGILACKFSEFSQSVLARETQRLLFALKAKSVNRLTVDVDVYQQYSIWHFWSRLPPQEEKLLRYIGWPKNGIANRTNEYVVRNEFNSILTLITDNLGVIRKEIRHE